MATAIIGLCALCFTAGYALCLVHGGAAKWTRRYFVALLEHRATHRRATEAENLANDRGRENSVLRASLAGARATLQLLQRRTRDDKR